jgi:hypothetical protein
MARTVSFCLASFCTDQHVYGFHVDEIRWWSDISLLIKTRTMIVLMLISWPLRRHHPERFIRAMCNSCAIRMCTKWKMVIRSYLPFLILSREGIPTHILMSHWSIWSQRSTIVRSSTMNNDIGERWLNQRRRSYWCHTRSPIFGPMYRYSPREQDIDFSVTRNLRPAATERQTDAPLSVWNPSW